jgi:hypothetical protein
MFLGGAAFDGNRKENTRIFLINADLAYFKTVLDPQLGVE